MHIAFDGTTLRPCRTGVGYYTEHLLRHAADQCGDDEISVISNTTVETTMPLPPHVQTHVRHSWMPRLVWMQMEAPRTLRRIHADVVHFTNGMVPLASPVPTVVTIHDMSLTMFPRFHPVRRVVLNRPFVNVASRRADAIITVSEARCSVGTGRATPPPAISSVVLSPRSNSMAPPDCPSDLSPSRSP